MVKKRRRGRLTTSGSRILRKRLQTTPTPNYSLHLESLCQKESSEVITIQNEKLEDESEENYNVESTSHETIPYFISEINLVLPQITNPLHLALLLTYVQRFLK